MEIKGRVAVVTGSSRGIGKAIAFVLAEEGATVVINCSKDVKNGEKVVKEIEERGGKAYFFKADVANAA